MTASRSCRFSSRWVCNRIPRGEGWRYGELPRRRLDASTASLEMCAPTPGFGSDSGWVILKLMFEIKLYARTTLVSHSTPTLPRYGHAARPRRWSEGFTGHRGGTGHVGVCNLSSRGVSGVGKYQLRRQRHTAAKAPLAVHKSHVQFPHPYIGGAVSRDSSDALQSVDFVKGARGAVIGWGAR